MLLPIFKWRLITSFSGDFLIVHYEHFHPCLVSVSQSTVCPSAAVRAVVGGPALLCFLLFEQEVSLCERVECFKNCATVLNTRC